MIRFPLMAGLILLAGSAFAQTSNAGMQTRPIKALSEQQVADLMTPESLKASTAAVATTQGALREAHLNYPFQLRLY